MYVQIMNGIMDVSNGSEKLLVNRTYCNEHLFSESKLTLCLYLI